MGFFTVNRRLLPIKFHYFLHNAGIATMESTMPVYTKVLGFSSLAAGTIFTVIPLVGLFINPLFGGLADKFKMHRSMLIATEVIIIAAYFSIQFIPKDHSGTSEAALNSTWAVCSSLKDEKSSYITATFKNATWLCDIHPEVCEKWNITEYCATYNTKFENNSNGSFQDQCLWLARTPSDPSPTDMPRCKLAPRSSKEVSEAETYSKWEFWLFLGLLVAAWGGSSFCTSLTNTICIEICGDPRLFGQQELWGAIGWGLLAAINGLIIDVFSVEGEEKNYTSAFYLMLPPLLLDIILSYYLKFSIPQQAESLVKDVRGVFLKPRNIAFAASCIMVGASFGLLWNFYYWLLEDLAAAYSDPSVNANIKTIEGLQGFVQTVIGEVPAYFVAGWIVNKLDHAHSITLILSLTSLRFILYSILVNPWWTLPIEILQSDYALFYCTMTSYAKKIAPPGTEATIQGILTAFCEGVGVALGNFIGGLLFDSYGGSITFRIFGISFLVMAINNEVLEYLFGIIDRKAHKAEDQVNDTISDTVV